jgi:hypothetical protein
MNTAMAFQTQRSDVVRVEGQVRVLPHRLDVMNVERDAITTGSTTCATFEVIALKDLIAERYPLGRLKNLSWSHDRLEVSNDGHELYACESRRQSRRAVVFLDLLKRIGATWRHLALGGTDVDDYGRVEGPGFVKNFLSVRPHHGRPVAPRSSKAPRFD